MGEQVGGGVSHYLDGTTTRQYNLVSGVGR